MILQWPSDLIPALDIDWQLSDASNSGGAAVDGQTNRYSITSGGGFWTLTLDGAALRKRAQVKNIRVLRNLSRSGAVPILVETCECGFFGADGMRKSQGVPHSDGTPFSDGTLYEGGGVQATAAPAALRDNEITITIFGGPLTGGEAFSISHAPPRGYDVGKRRYEVDMITSTVFVPAAGDVAAHYVQVVSITPNLRAELAEETVIDFKNVGCFMRLTNASSFMSSISQGRFGSVSPAFIEAS
jgi:hypothetical protein